MAEILLEYECPSCGAGLAFNAENQMLTCDSCDSTFQEEFFKQHMNENLSEDIAEGEVNNIDWNIDGFVKQKEEMEAQPGYNCESCGAEVVSDGNTVATECMYCGNPLVIADNISGMVTPDLVIPFKLDKNQAKEMLINFYKGKRLLPNEFKDENRISKITGMYVPFWLFSCKGSGNVSFKATKVRTWSDSSYNYTQTKTYEAFRAGDLGFDKIPVDASTKMDDNYMDGIEPFDYNDMVNFAPMYMAGYFADKFDVSVDDSSVRASDRVISSVEDAFRDTVRGYNTVSKSNSFVQMHGEDIKYALLPVWMLNTKYNDKMYQFAINGQTGRVAGELPIDKGKLFRWRLGLTLACAVPITAIALWLFS